MPLLSEHTRRLLTHYVAERARDWLSADVRRTRAGLARVAGLHCDQVHALFEAAAPVSEVELRALARALGAEWEGLAHAAATWAQEHPPEPVRASLPRPSARVTPRSAARRKSTPRAARGQVGAREDRYPNRQRALRAARLLDHAEQDIATVLAIVLPPGASDPSPRAWAMWVERARDERLDAERATHARAASPSPSPFPGS